MLHKLLNLERPLIILDTETTGVNPDKDRIVQLGFQAWGPSGLEKEWRSLVNPDTPIPTDAYRVHGISDLAVADAPRFYRLAKAVQTGFTNCDFAGKRVRFDLRIVAAEMQRAGVEWSYTRARIIDADRLEQLAVPRTLSDLYEKYIMKPCPECNGEGFYLNAGGSYNKCAPCYGTGKIGVKLDSAHDALTDVKATAAVIVGQFEAHPNLPRDLDELHKLQWPGWIDGESKFKFVNGVPTCMFGKHRDWPMKSIPKDYWDWLLSMDFSAEIKALAREAKLGKFPEDKR